METPEEKPNLASTDGDISPLSVTAIQVHEIFTELKASGFSHQDAIQIVGFMLSSGIMFRPDTSFGYGNIEILEDFDFDPSLDFGDEEDYPEDERDENPPLS